MTTSKFGAPPLPGNWESRRERDGAANPASAKCPRDAGGRFGRTLPFLLNAIIILLLVIEGMALAPAFAYQRGRGPKAPPKSKQKQKPLQELGDPTKDKENDDKEKDSDERHKLSDIRAEGALPRYQDMQVPTVEELHKRPVDWLLLKGPNKTNEQVIVVKQVFPRPDTLKKLEKSLEDLRRRSRPETDAEREKFAAERNELQNLIVTLPEDPEGQLYEIPTQIIDRIIYHEDLIIRRANLIIEQKQFRDAFELLYALARQAPAWNGLEDQMQRLLFAEAHEALDRGDLENGYTYLEELDARNRDYPALQAQLGDAVDKLILAARKRNDYRESRHFLDRIARIEPKHDVVAKWTKSLSDDAQKQIDAAFAAGSAGHHDEALALVDQAARIWPKASGLKEAHLRLSNRYQRLRVGVLHLPGETRGLPFSTLADQREARLTHFNLFEVDRVDESTHYRSRLIEQWEPTDLGRRAVFNLKATRARWESRPILTATDVLTTMQAMLDPASPAYDERMSSYIGSIALRSPFEFEIRFSRTPPRTEPLFRFPVRAPANASEGSASPSGLGPNLSRRFERARADDNEVVYRRAFPQPDGLDEYHLAEIREQKFSSPEHAIQGLLRGDVSLLPDLPPWAVAALRNDSRFFVLDYAIPTTHVLQFNPRSTPLKSRELRLAMAYAIDTRHVLARTVLRDPGSLAGRLTTAPFATTSYAYDSLVPLREPNSSIAISLAEAATKRLKSIPVLRMACDPQFSAMAAAHELISEWKRVGIRVELVDPPTLGAGSNRSGYAGESSPSDGNAAPTWDFAYRALRMEEPLVELWPFLAVDSRARLESQRHFPDWLRQELLALDNAPDWKSAVARLHSLQAHLYAEVEYIPLWEIDDTLVMRKIVRGFPPFKFVNTYQYAERWIVQSWFPEDAP